jgi:hypothetical protein
MLRLYQSKKSLPRPLKLARSTLGTILRLVLGFLLMSTAGMSPMKQIYRVWTSHEQALAACHGDENTSSDSPFDHAPTPLLYRLTVIEDADLVISDDEPLVAIKFLQSVNWTSGLMLSGGIRRPQRYILAHLRLNTPASRPKPQPPQLARKTVHFQDQRVDVEGVGAIWAMVKVNESAKKTRERMPLDTLDENGEDLTVLHQSKRARTTLQRRRFTLHLQNL